jgi:hypothetical protein
MEIGLSILVKISVAFVHLKHKTDLDDVKIAAHKIFQMRWNY